MASVKKIILKGRAGMFPCHGVWRDRLEISKNSIRYRITSVCEPGEDLKWSYNSTGESFEILFSQIVKEIERTFNNEEGWLMCDGNELEIIVTFEDETRKAKTLHVPSEDYDSLKKAIYMLVPKGEKLAFI